MHRSQERSLMSFDNCIHPCTSYLSGGVKHFHQPGEPLTSPVKPGPVPSTRPGRPRSDFYRQSSVSSGSSCTWNPAAPTRLCQASPPQHDAGGVPCCCVGL